MLDVIEVFGAILCAVFHLLVRSIEFLLVACTKGRSEAHAQFERRVQQQSEARGNAAVRRAEREEAEAHETRRSIATVTAAMIVFGVPVGALFAWHYHARLQARRTEATKVQIARLADEFHEQVQDDKRPDPKPGLLEERDAWDEPLTLCVDESPFGCEIIVRSAGRDREMGTGDDLSAARYVNPTKKEIAGVVVKIGLHAAQARLKKMLKGEEEEEGK